METALREGYKTGVRLEVVRATRPESATRRDRASRWEREVGN